MKKIFKGFLVFMMIFSFIAKYKALDEREVLTEIVVTSNTSSIPNYKGVIASPVFNITSGSEAHFDTSQGFWRRLGDRLLDLMVISLILVHGNIVLK